MRAVRLPAQPAHGEIRIWWDNTPEQGNDLHVFGPSALRRYAMAILDARPVRFRDGLTFVDRSRIESESLTRGRSPLEELEAAGYDPRTLVLSIRPRDATPSDEPAASDIVRQLEQAQAAMATLMAALGEAEEAKGVYVLDAEGRDAIVEAATLARDATDAALGVAARLPDPQGGIAPDPAAVEAEALATDGRTRLGVDDFDKVMVLSWDDDSDEEEISLGLHDKDARVGVVYGPRGGPYRWRCTPTDRRSSEDTFQAAKDALVFDYAQNYANEARDLLRASLRREADSRTGMVDGVAPG